TFPAPFFRARLRVEGSQRAAAVRADMSDEQAAIDHWRRGCAEIRRAEFLAPERLAGLGVKTRKNTVDSEGANPAVSDHWRRFDSLTVADGRWVHGIGGGIAFLPDYLPGFRPQARDHFEVDLPRVKAACADDNTRLCEIVTNVTLTFILWF